MTDTKNSRGDWLFFAVMVALTSLVVCVGVGCATTVDVCSTCPPRLEIQTIKEPIPCSSFIALLDPLILPPRPSAPDLVAASDGDVTNWLADLRATIDEREVATLAYIDALMELITTNNRLRPLCTDVIGG